MIDEGEEVRGVEEMEGGVEHGDSVMGEVRGLNWKVGCRGRAIAYDLDGAVN